LFDFQSFQECFLLWPKKHEKTAWNHFCWHLKKKQILSDSDVKVPIHVCFSVSLGSVFCKWQKTARRAWPVSRTEQKASKTFTGGLWRLHWRQFSSALQKWLQEKTKTWEEAVADLASVAPNFPQTACSGPQKCLQQERQFVQRVMKGIGPGFADVDLALFPRPSCQLSLEMTVTRMILDAKSPVPQ
jgi:hypothetical protein